ncbi:hypothetical protein ABXV24_04060 [Vibrio owensii]|uniref:hypothetical protein n=1 Tax=Vibrio owensii TaxID=696485 RepID=UPI003397A973
MNNKLLLISSTLLGSLLSNGALASTYFDDSCKVAGGVSYEGVVLSRLFTDGTAQNRGLYISDQQGQIWQIKDVFDNKLVIDSLVDSSKTAVVLGNSVNICADPVTSPRTVWTLELNQ